MAQPLRLVKPFLLCAFAFISSHSQGQFFKPVTHQSASLYTTAPERGETSSLTVLDTSHVDNDVVFNLFKKWTPDSPWESLLTPDEDCTHDSWGSGGLCAPANIPQWLGPKIVETASNEYAFFTSIGDTLNFNFELNPGDSSLFYSENDETYYLIYEESDLETHINFTDSVSTYRIAHLDPSGEPVNSNLHNAPVTIGKELGMIEFFRIDSFPIQLQPIQIAGHLGTESGLHKIMASDIFDYEVGDVFQYRYVQNEYAPGVGYATYSTRTVISREENDTAIAYTYDVEEVKLQSVVEMIDGLYVSSTDTILSSEILEEVIDKSEVMAELPLHEHDSNMPYVFEDVNYIESNCGDRWQYVRRSSVWYRCYSDSIPCYVNPQNFGDNASYAIYSPHVYEMGIGLVSERDGWQSPSGSNIFSTNLIYYEKDGNACGEQWMLLSTDDREVLGKLKLWPNPAKEVIQVALPHQMEKIERVEIYNSAGILVEQLNHQKQGTLNIDISNFPPGLYLVKAIVDKGLYTQKLVVH